MRKPPAGGSQSHKIGRFGGTALVLCYVSPMRCRIMILISVGLMAGCAASNNEPSQARLTERTYAPAASTALAFDTPVGPGQVVPNLSRDDRGVSAYGGFPTESAEFYDIQVDDDQVFLNYPSSYERRVQSDRVGVIYR